MQGWSIHLKALGKISSEEAALGTSVPRAFASLPSRKVDYLLGLAREALEANEFNRARELVAEAKFVASGAPRDDESFSQLEQLANQIEIVALNSGSNFPY